MVVALVGADTPPPASTFYIDSTETQFSLNVANNSPDVSIYFTSPAYSWVAVGFGEKMKGSLIFVLYPSSDGSSMSTFIQSTCTVHWNMGIDMIQTSQLVRASQTAIQSPHSQKKSILPSTQAPASATTCSFSKPPATIAGNGAQGP